MYRSLPGDNEYLILYVHVRKFPSLGSQDQGKDIVTLCVPILLTCGTDICSANLFLLIGAGAGWSGGRADGGCCNYTI